MRLIRTYIIIIIKFEVMRQQTLPTNADVFMVEATLRPKRREVVTENTFAGCIKAPEVHNEVQDRSW